MAIIDTRRNPNSGSIISTGLILAKYGCRIEIVTVIT